jgi:hypothetical protein
MEATLSFESRRAIRIFTGDDRAHRILLLALSANGLTGVAASLTEGSARAVAIGDDQRSALGRALATWLAEL